MLIHGGLRGFLRLRGARGSRSVCAVNGRAEGVLETAGDALERVR